MTSIPLQFGDVVLVPFPFTNQTTSKQRPAVIVSNLAYNQAKPDVVVMAITSQFRPSPTLGEVWIGHWQAAGLLQALCHQAGFRHTGTRPDRPPTRQARRRRPRHPQDGNRRDTWIKTMNLDCLISGIEGGLRNPSLDVIVRIARHLKTTPAALLAPPERKSRR